VLSLHLKDISRTSLVGVFSVQCVVLSLQAEDFHFFIIGCTEIQFYFSSTVVLAALKIMADARNMDLSSLSST
jgi:hypothetical protein